MIKALMRKRCLEKYRLLDEYWCIAIDGIHLVSFDEKHCENCLKKEYHDKDTTEVVKTIYYHVQISDIIRQLLEHGSVAIREFKLGMKEIS